MEILFATNNAHKLAEVSAVLGDGYRLVTPRDCGVTGEIPEAHPRRQRAAKGPLPARPHGPQLLCRRHGARSRSARRSPGRTLGPLRHRRSRLRGQQSAATAKLRGKNEPPGPVPHGHRADSQRGRTPVRGHCRGTDHPRRTRRRRIRLRPAVRTRGRRQDVRRDERSREKRRLPPWPCRAQTCRLFAFHREIT